ncbi:hypothetical protein [Nocardia sp. R7R-8]|uniref:hypothetical protein n=1 Tax=Nocardia sp. R7R-8 TaxID=3459304 RepID=UPI00403D8A9C
MSKAAPAGPAAVRRLVLRSPDRTVTLLDKKIARPDTPIKVTPWLVVALITDNSQIRARALDEARPTLVIAEDNGVSGNAGKTTATVDADTLTIRNDNGAGLVLHAGERARRCPAAPPSRWPRS